MSIYSLPLMDFLLKQLTPREREVKHLIALGYANKNIAAELGVSQRTVEAHRASIFRKLGVRNAVELVNVLRSRTDRALLMAEPTECMRVEPVENIQRDAVIEIEMMMNKASDQKKLAKEADSEENPD